MECKFFVGQKVVCINDVVGEFDVPGIIYNKNLDGLTKGNVYTIRAIFKTKVNTLGVSVRLEEIIRSPVELDGGVENGFAWKRFRATQIKGMEMLNSISADPEKFKNLYDDEPVETY